MGLRYYFLAVEGELVSSTLQRSSNAHRDGQLWTEGLGRLAPPRRVHSGPRGSIYSKAKRLKQTQQLVGPALVVARPDLVRRPRQAQMHVARREDRAFRIDEDALRRQRRMRSW